MECATSAATTQRAGTVRTARRATSETPVSQTRHLAPANVSPLVPDLMEQGRSLRKGIFSHWPPSVKPTESWASAVLDGDCNYKQQKSPTVHVSTFFPFSAFAPSRHAEAFLGTNMPFLDMDASL